MIDDRFARLRVARFILWPLASVVAFAIIAQLAHIPRDVRFIELSVVLYGAMLLAVRASCAEAGMHLPEVFGPMPARATQWIRTALIVPPLLITDVLLVLLCVTIAAQLAPELTKSLLSRRSAAAMFPAFGASSQWLFVLIACVLAPVVEELVFRGLLLRRFIAARGFWPGIILTSAIFAILHPVQIFSAFLSGLVFALLYLSSRSLYLPILAHSLQNSVVTFAYLVGSATAERDDPAKFLAGLRDAILPNILALLVVGGALLLLVRPLASEARANASSQGTPPVTEGGAS